mmetsp:Transcript_44132/g.116785  ORF Transcript_44132/g.116785 Transcript_44132/m.116785 type:complete len:211 (-) Transcript_44132:481-1113(-)
MYVTPLTMMGFGGFDGTLVPISCASDSSKLMSESSTSGPGEGRVRHPLVPAGAVPAPPPRRGASTSTEVGRKREQDRSSCVARTGGCSAAGAKESTSIDRDNWSLEISAESASKIGERLSRAEVRVHSDELPTGLPPPLAFAEEAGFPPVLGAAVHEVPGGSASPTSIPSEAPLYLRVRGRIGAGSLSLRSALTSGGTIGPSPCKCRKHH